VLGLRPGPEVGRVLHALMERVTDDPGLNTGEALVSILRSMESAGVKEGPGANTDETDRKRRNQIDSRTESDRILHAESKGMHWGTPREPHG